MKFRILRYALFLFLLLCGKSFSQNGDPLYSVSVTKVLMGTLVEVSARHSDINLCRRALRSAFEEMKRIESLMSYQIDNSEISLINSSAGIHPVKVSSETFGVIKRSLGYSKLSGGLFDITIGAVSSLWGFNGEREVEIPDSLTLDSLLKFVNYKNIELNYSDTTVFLKLSGMELDLGGIAKGYAIDRGAAILRSMDVNNFILNAGGDIYASGRKDKNMKWTVGVKDPRDPSGIIADFKIENFAAATSGDYERFKIIDGVRYHHILNPFTGFPGKLSESATVLAPTAEKADALATYLFLLGNRKALAEKSIDFPFLIVSAEGKLYYNKLLKQNYSLNINKP